MSKNTAFKAIDFYYQQIKKQALANKGNEEDIGPNLSFYGGEPLLNHNLLFECIEYFRKLDWQQIGYRYDKLSVSLTTNLTTPNKSVLDRLIEDGVNVLVSLDGPKEETDKYRKFLVYKHSVFDSIVYNLNYIFKKNPDYFERHIHFSAVYAPGHDAKKINEFFSTQSHLPFSHLMQGNRVHLSTAHYSACPDALPFHVDDIIAWNAELERAYKTLEMVINDVGAVAWREQSVFKNVAYRILYDIEHRPIFKHGEAGVDSVPTCIPSKRKIFVSTDGNFHICERTDQSMAIGNILTGYDIAVIKRMLKNYFEIMNSEGCRNCWGFRFCQFCPAPLIQNGNIFAPEAKQCEGFLKNLESYLKHYIQLKLNFPSIIDELFCNKAHAV